MSSLIVGLSGAERADIEGSVQRLSQGRRVSLCTELVNELENSSDIVVDLEHLHGQGGLKVRKRSFLRRLCVPHWGFNIRQTGFDILKTHGRGVEGGEKVALA